MDIRSSLLHITGQLSESGIEHPAMEARILLSHLLCKPKEFLISHGEQELEANVLRELEGLVNRRRAMEPIAYITGIKEFFGRDFIVDSNVLLPRPDSETLIEAVLANATEEPKILELGVGSGCLIITLLLELEGATGLGLDIDKWALAVAASNAQKHGAGDRVELIESDWFRGLSEQKFDIIISNPPYISSDERVAKETLLYEPHKALFAGKDGLEAYMEIANKAGDFLKPEGMIYLEIGYDQEDSVAELFVKNGYRVLGKYKDLAGYVRCLGFSRCHISKSLQSDMKNTILNISLI